MMVAFKYLKVWHREADSNWILEKLPTTNFEIVGSIIQNGGNLAFPGYVQMGELMGEFLFDSPTLLDIKVNCLKDTL